MLSQILYKFVNFTSILLFNPFPNKPLFLHVCSTSLENTVEKWEFARYEQFLVFHTVFYPFGELSSIFIELKFISKLLQFERVWMLSFGKGFIKSWWIEVPVAVLCWSSNRSQALAPALCVSSSNLLLSITGWKRDISKPWNLVKNHGRSANSWKEKDLNWYGEVYGTLWGRMVSVRDFS